MIQVLWTGHLIIFMFLYVSINHLEDASNTPWHPRSSFGPHDIRGPRQHLGESNRWSALPLPPPSSSAPELLIGCRCLMQIASGEDFAVTMHRKLLDIIFCRTDMGHWLIGHPFPFQEHFTIAIWRYISHLQAQPILAAVQGEWTGSPITETFWKRTM